MKYEVLLMQTTMRSYSDGDPYEHTEEIRFKFGSFEDVEAFLNLASLNAEGIKAEITFIKESEE